MWKKCFTFLILLSLLFTCEVYAASCSCPTDTDLSANIKVLKDTSKKMDSFGKLMDVDYFDISSDGKLTIRGFAYIKGLGNFTKDSNFCYCSTSNEKLTGTFYANTTYEFRFVKMDDPNVFYILDPSEFKYIDRKDLFREVCELSGSSGSNSYCFYYRTTLHNTFVQNDQTDGGGRIFAQHYRGGYAIENFDLQKIVDYTGKPGKYKLQVSISVRGSHKCSSGTPKAGQVFDNYINHWDDLLSGGYDNEWHTIGGQVTKGMCGDDKTRTWVDVDAFLPNVDEINNKNDNVKITVQNQAVSIVNRGHPYKTNGDRILGTYMPGIDARDKSYNIFTIKNVKNSFPFKGINTKAYYIGTSFPRFALGRDPSGTYKYVYSGNTTLAVASSWLQHNGHIEFNLKNDDAINKPNPQKCEDLGDGYTEVLTKSNFYRRTFSTNNPSEASYLNWKGICGGSTSVLGLVSGHLERTFSPSEIETFDLNKYDLNTLQVVRGETHLVTDDASLANTISVGGAEAQALNLSNSTVLKLGIINEWEPKLTKVGSDYKITVDTITSKIVKESKYLDGNPACMYNQINTNGQTSDMMYHPAILDIKFCAREKEAVVCENNSFAAKCDSDNNKMGKAYYHESDEYTTCTLKEQNNSGFKIVKSNGKDGSTPKDNLAKTNTESRYCTVACKDDIDIEYPNLKEAFIGGKYDLNLGKGNEYELNHGPTVQYQRTCLTSKIDVDKFKSDIYAQSKEVQRLYEEYRDLKYISEHIKVDHSSNPSWHEQQCQTGTNEDGTPIMEDCGHSDCKYEWRIYQQGNIPNGSTGGSRQSTITNFTAKNGEKTEHNTSCNNSSTPWQADLTRIETESSSDAENKWEEYVAAKGEQKSMEEEITACYSWTNKDKLYNDVTVKNPEVKYSYQDNDLVAGSLTAESIPLDANKNIINYSDSDTMLEKDYSYNPSLQNPYSAGYYLKKYYHATCSDDENSNENQCERQQTELLDAHHYIRRLETKKWQYLIDKGTKTVYSTESGKFTTAADTTNPDNYPPGFDIKLTGFNVTPILMKTKAKDGYFYKLEYDNLDDTTRKKYTNANLSLTEKTVQDKKIFNGETYGGSYGTKHSFVCNYNVKSNGSKTPTPPGGTPPGGTPPANTVNFFYRTINVNNINPNNRDLGYNWNATNAGSIIDLIKQTDNYQVLTGNAVKTGINTKDKYSDAITFTLSPSLMKDIRENYNKDNVYSDSNKLNCENKNDLKKRYCKSKFLECLTGQGPESNCVTNNSLRANVSSGDSLSDIREKIKAKNDNYIQ